MNAGEDNGGTRIGEVDRQWFVYALALPLSPVIGAMILEALSEKSPFQAMCNDGSLVMFCFVTVWLTFGAYREELRRGAWDREHDAPVWSSYEKLRTTGEVGSILAALAYAAVVLEPEMSENLRISLSGVAVVFGLIYARLVLGVHYKVSQRSLRISP